MEISPHGLGTWPYCLGCCWTLMLLLFVGGVMNLLDLPLEGTHHRGDDAAWNTALILAKLLAR